jgi:hypothetical protein
MRAVALTLCLMLGAEPEQESLRVAPGAQQVLRIEGLVRVAVGDPEVADVRVTGASEVMIVGRRSGRTSLTIWTRRGEPQTRTVVVADDRLASLAAAIREKVGGALVLTVLDDKLVVDGMLHSVEDWQRLKTLVEGEPGVKLLVRLDPAVLPALAKQITAALRRAGLGNATAVAVGSRIVLEGSVADEAELKKAQLIADAYYSDFAVGR